MAGRRIVVEFLGQDKNLGKTADQVESKTGRMGDRMSKVGKIAGVALAGGFLAAGAAAIKMTKGAAEDEASASKLAQTLKTAAGATKGQIAANENWITTIGKAYGVTDDELRPALGRLAAATHDVTKAQDLAYLAMDVSAGTGKSLEAVTTALAKAQNGSVGGLARLGVATKDAHGKTKSLKQITDDLTKTYSGAASKAADTTAGKQKILTTQFGELQETIGYKLLPVMSKLADLGVKTVDWMSKNGAVLKPLAIILGSFVGTLFLVVKATQAYTAVQAALNVVMAMNPIGLVVIAIAALVAGLIIAYKKSETFRNIVNGAFTAVKTVAGGVLTWLTSAVKNTIEFVRNHWKLILAILTGPIGAAAILIISNFGKIKTAGTNVVNWIKDIPGKLKALGKDFKDAGAHLIGKFVDGMKNAAGIISGIAGNVWDTVKRLLNKAIDKINTALEFKISLPGPDISINPPNIPHLAKGGIVRARPGGTLALLGEAGRDEMVVPLGGPSSRRSADGGFLGTVAVDLRLDGRTIQTVLLKLKRERGGHALGIA